MTHPSRDTIFNIWDVIFLHRRLILNFYIFIYNNLKYFFISGRYLQVQQWPHFTFQQSTAWIHSVRQGNGSHAPTHMILDVRLFFSSALGKTKKKFFFVLGWKDTRQERSYFLYVCPVFSPAESHQYWGSLHKATNWR